MDLVGLARQVQTADQFVRATTGGKLQVILDQIRYLQQQVRARTQKYCFPPCFFFAFFFAIKQCYSLLVRHLVLGQDDSRGC